MTVDVVVAVMPAGQRGSSKFCGGRRSRNLDNTFEDESYDDDGEYSRESGDGDIRPPSIGNVDREDMDLYADLTPDEKQKFLQYMHSGLSIEESSKRVLQDRQRRGLKPTNSFQSKASRTAKQRLQAEMMADGQTMVHVPQHLHGTPGTTRRYNNPMVLSETASSVASSFDDREYLRRGADDVSALDLGKASAYSQFTPSSLGNSRASRQQYQRGEETPAKAMGQSILCFPESAI